MSFLKNFGVNLKRQAATVPLHYSGGHPELNGNIIVGVGGDSENLIIYTGMTFNKSVLQIPKSDIINVSVDKASSRSLGKAAAGAVIGGVLTGGLGLLAGAALGGRKKDESVIVLRVKYQQMEVEMLFDGGNIPQKYGQFMALLKNK